ncbi:hypothetical protein NDU88_007009 [Pleurodeles waltl]|uniref:Uncharacterized protein n=1 Tax=Pleurodeles waltl TaxID=8319 RepID=A0AAV7SRB5_PLEWA|nr:hypothetical protein NDU88_007009 [Pleurodeles waltl]
MPTTSVSGFFVSSPARHCCRAFDSPGIRAETHLPEMRPLSSAGQLIQSFLFQRRTSSTVRASLGLLATAGAAFYWSAPRLIWAAIRAEDHPPDA